MTMYNDDDSVAAALILGFLAFIGAVYVIGKLIQSL